MGDGFFVTFEGSRAAAECAKAIQQALARHRQEHGFSPQVRIGIHEAEATRKGNDRQGKGVHMAARIGALAAGGEILASRSAATDLGRVALSNPRTVNLKGLWNRSRCSPLIGSRRSHGLVLASCGTARAVRPGGRHLRLLWCACFFRRATAQHSRPRRTRTCYGLPLRSEVGAPETSV